MNHNILSWNVRGLNEGRKRLKIRNLLSKWKVDIVCLQETKLKMVSNQLVQSLWRCPYKEWCHMDSCGASGGILLMWDRRVVSKIEVCLGNFVVACSFRNVEDGFLWAFAGVYGPNSNGLRRFLWEELAGLLTIWAMPWCIGGDFNATIFLRERSGGAGFRRAASEFADFIVDHGLMDLPLGGGSIHVVQLPVLVSIGPFSSLSGLGDGLSRVGSEEASSCLFRSCSYYVD
jgi:hypothetical protein